MYRKYRTKEVAKFFQPIGNSETPDTTAVTVIEKDSSDNVLRATGTSVPGSEAGFSKGCIFIKTDASAGTEGIYRNTGTTTVSSFEALDTITPTEIALAEGSLLVGNASNKAAAIEASGDTKILIGNGTTVASFALTSDVTMTNGGVTTVAALDLETATVTNIVDTEIMIGTGVGTANFAALSGELTITNAGVATVGILASGKIIRATNDTATGSNLILSHVSASPTAFDTSSISMYANNSVGAEINYAAFLMGIADPTSTTEAGFAGIVLNEGGATIPHTHYAATWTDGECEMSYTDDGNDGYQFILRTVSASPAANDEVGIINFSGKDSAANDQDYAQIIGTIVDPTSAAEYGSTEMYVLNGGNFQNEADLVLTSGLATFTWEDSNVASGYKVQFKTANGASAADDIVTEFDFYGTNDAGANVTYAYQRVYVDDATAGAEIGSLGFLIENGTGTPGEGLFITHNGSYGVIETGFVKTEANTGTEGTGVEAEEFGDGMNHTTVLTLTNVDLGAVSGAGAEAHGAKIYEFPAGDVHIQEVTHMNVGVVGDAGVQADTPNIGIGSVVGSGANATLTAVGATSMDYITEQTMTNANGAATAIMTAATAGYGTGISLNATGDVKDVFLNIADTWAAASAALLATGTVVIKWTSME